MESPKRRQNHSCDPCRRSKRRCVVLNDRGDGIQRCRNCARLGNKCTFEFANTHNPSKRMRFSQNLEVGEAFNATTEDSSIDIAGISMPENTALNSPVSLFGSPQDELPDASFLPIDNVWGALFQDPFELMYPFSPTWTGSGAMDSDYATELPIFGSDDIPANYSQTATGTDVVPCQRLPTSPLNLLNSGITIRMVNGQMSATYYSLTKAMHVRYLSQRLNAFAKAQDGEPQTALGCRSQPSGTRSVEIDIAQSPPNELTERLDSEYDPVSPDSEAVVYTLYPSAGPISMIPSSGWQPRKVTLLGASRFLDNFAWMYGNQRSQAERDQDDAAITSVAQAFVLQHVPAENANLWQIPLGGDNDPVVKDAWLKAYHALAESISRPSFLLVYAVFMFDLLPVPLDARNDQHPPVDKQGLLDRTLQHMQSLLASVESFCAHLNDDSTYRSMLHACLRVVKWHGYVRDTIASSASDRPCVLDAVPWQPPGEREVPSVPDTQELTTFEAALPATCQYACGQLFGLYRAIIRLRECLDVGSSDGLHSLSAHLGPVQEMIESFKCVYGSWLQHGMDCFAQLSANSQISLGFLDMFWNLGLLLVFEAVDSARNGSSSCSKSSHPYQLATNYRTDAVHAFATISKLIMDVSMNYDLPVLDSSDIKLPFMAHHANTTLVVTALQKAIKHTIGYHVEASREHRDRLGHVLKPLLWCLLSLERTSSGRTTARPALNDLLYQHGDILMDCWALDGIHTSL